MNISEMYVVKRGNRGTEALKFDKITLRLKSLSEGLEVSPELVALQTIKNIYNGIHVEQLDIISANIADSMKLVHPDYGVLAGKILISNLHKTTPAKFSECMEVLSRELNIIDPVKLQYVRENADSIDSMIDCNRDYMFNYNAILTLEKQFLHRINGLKEVYDRPQYMYMRVAIQVGKTLDRIREYYDALSQHKFTFATPTNFNSLTVNPQLNSCFLLSTDDSIEDIMHTITNTALISKRAGGIGIAMHKIRTAGSIIKGTNGVSDGVFPQLKIYDANALCWNQGGGKRKGAVAIYTELWNADIRKILELKLTTGLDEIRARNLFYAVWVCDLFMKRLHAGTQWSLFSDDTAPGLSEVYDGMFVCTKCGHCQNADYLRLVERGVLTPDDCGGALDSAKFNSCQHALNTVNVFTNLYERYEREGRARAVVDPKIIESAICMSQRESGGPYVCFKDHANRQSNHQNLGTLQSSNLCAEIYEWHSKESYACCSLASINLTAYVRTGTTGELTNANLEQFYDFDALHDITRLIVRGLDRNVQDNDYPVSECSVNALNYRPIAVGVQGLADVFIKLGLPFLSDVAEALDMRIFETIYHAALCESTALASELGSYTGFETSPISRGILRQDLWMQNQVGGELTLPATHYDWDDMRQRVRGGVRCSLHVALMPTVTTSQILGNNESFEPIPSILYTKNTLAGKLTVVCDQFVRDCIKLGIWNESLKNEIINASGSVQTITSIPIKMREIYKTVWEMRQSDLMRRAALRQAYIDQGQSLNIHTSVNTDSRLRGIFRTGWKLGLNTGSYYIRTTSTVDPLKNNIAQSADGNATNAVNTVPTEGAACEIGCTSCGS